MVWKAANFKPLNRKPLFDIELYIMYNFIKYYSSSFHVSSQLPYWTITSLYENTMSSITVTVRKLT
jgi:hypothetical protein